MAVVPDKQVKTVSAATVSAVFAVRELVVVQLVAAWSAEAVYSRQWSCFCLAAAEVATAVVRSVVVVR